MAQTLSRGAQDAEIVVINWKHWRGRRLDGAVEYIGRYSPEFGYESPLKNEWSHLANTRATHRVGSVEEAVACYHKWLLGEVKNPRSAAYLELERLARVAMRGRLYLACWCRGEHACHGDVVERALRWMITQIELREAPAGDEPAPEGPAGGGHSSFANMPVGALLAAAAPAHAYAL